MSDRPAKGMKYLHMGPWPGFIGLCFDEKVFQKEIKRLGVKSEVKFLAHGRAAATVHELISTKGSPVWIVAVGPTKGRTKEMVAAIVAHEAVHIVQWMRTEVGDMGSEGEAYLVQMIVQEALQMLWKSNKVRAEVPSA